MFELQVIAETVACNAEIREEISDEAIKNHNPSSKLNNAKFHSDHFIVKMVKELGWAMGKSLFSWSRIRNIRKS